MTTTVPSENLIRPLSGRTTLVPMVQSPDLGERAVTSPKSRSWTARRSAHPIQIRGFASMMHRDQERCTNAPRRPEL